MCPRTKYKNQSFDLREAASEENQLYHVQKNYTTLVQLIMT